MRIEEIISEGVNDPHILKAVFVAGPPGAGKNTVIKELGLASTGLKMIDADKVISLLNKPHDEQSYTAARNTINKRQSLYKRQMLGMMINTTGRNYEATMAVNDELKAAGYETFMLFVDVAEDVAWGRAQNRKKYATDPADQRAVTRDYFDQAYPDSMRNQSMYAMAFGDDYAKVTNNEDRVVEDEETFASTIANAARKLRRFLTKPVDSTHPNLLK